MADPSVPDVAKPKPIRPSWLQIFGLLAAGVILVPGLCLVVATSSSTIYNVGVVVIGLLGLSLLLTLLAAILGVIRIVKDIRRR